jgi:hypothetical protein
MENLVKGIANFEGEMSTNMVAYCDPRDTWNGWAKPFIHYHFIGGLLEMLNGGDDSYQLEGDSLHIINYDDGEVVYDGVIEPTIIEGEKYYNLGFEGICFDFEALDNKKTRAVIVEIEGLQYDEDVEELKIGEVVEVLTLDNLNGFVWVLSESGVEHGIDSDRIILI